MIHGWLSAAHSLVVPFKTVELVTINQTEAAMYLQDLLLCWKSYCFSSRKDVS
jgi:hypothetical protein